MEGAFELGPRFTTPTIEQGVTGPRGEAGFLLRAPRSEELIWDLEMEVVAARRQFRPDLDAWWISAPYLQTVIAIVLRTFSSVLVLGRDEDRLISRDGGDNVQGRLL